MRPSDSTQSDDGAWIVTAGGTVYEMSSLGDEASFEAIIGGHGYADALDAVPITDAERLREVAVRLRQIADTLDATRPTSPSTRG